MTRDEYNQKYGVTPTVNEPIKMTRSQYQAKYGQMPQQQGERTLGGFAGNVAKSAGQNALGMAQGIVNVANPNMDQNTLATVARTVQGGLQKLDPTEGKVIANTIGDMTPIKTVKMIDQARGMSTDYQPQAEAVGQMYKDRYGGIENIKKTAYEDPVGVALDASMVLGGAGAGLKGVGSLAKSSRLAKAGQIASKVGRVIDPVSMAGKGLSKVGSVVKPKIVGALEGMSEGYATSGLGDPKLIKEIQGVTGKKTSQLMKEYDLFDRSPASASKAIDSLDTIMSSKIQGAPKARVLDILKQFDEKIAQYKNSATLSTSARGQLEELIERRGDFVDYIKSQGKTKKSFTPDIKNYTPINVKNKVNRYTEINPKPKGYTPIEFKYKGWKNQKITAKPDNYTPIKIKNKVERFKEFSPSDKRFTKLNIRKYQEYPESIPAEQVREMKQKVGTDVKNFAPDASKSIQTASAQDVYNIYKDKLNELAGTKQLGRDEAGLIKLKEIFKNSEARGQSRQALGLKDFVAGGAGGTIGGVPGAIGGIALRQFLDSPKGIQIVTEMLQKGAGGVNKMKVPNVFKDLIKGAKYERMTNPK